MRRLIIPLIIGLVCAATPSAMAQEESPSPSGGGEECQVGELCTIVNPEVGQQEESGPINDPPGDVRTSLITMGFIAIFVGTYFFFALSGRSLPHLVRMPGRKG